MIYCILFLILHTFHSNFQCSSGPAVLSEDSKEDASIKARAQPAAAVGKVEARAQVQGLRGVAAKLSIVQGVDELVDVVAAP